MSRTVQFALNVTWGAGGASISPMLSVQCLVRSGSPAFALFEGLDLVENYEKYFSYAFSQVIQLFHKGKASPYDITEDGLNLIHARIPF